MKQREKGPLDVLRDTDDADNADVLNKLRNLLSINVLVAAEMKFSSSAAVEPSQIRCSRHRSRPADDFHGCDFKVKSERATTVLAKPTIS